MKTLSVTVMIDEFKTVSMVINEVSVTHCLINDSDSHWTLVEFFSS